MAIAPTDSALGKSKCHLDAWFKELAIACGRASMCGISRISYRQRSSLSVGAG